MEANLLAVMLCVQFMVVGRAVHPGCECLVYSTTHGKEMGTFHSPDFPKPYAQGIDCVLYTFVGRPNEVIQIVFQEFDVKRKHKDCISGDYLKLFLHLEGGEVNEYTPWETVLCGSLIDIPTVLYSSGPGLVLEFHSGPERTNSTGFSGTFRFMDRRLFKTGGQKLSGSACDYQFASAESPGASYGNFYSPRYPSSYPKNVKCSYRFRARNRERIQLVFEEISLQKGDVSCLNRADIIRIYDGLSPASPSIKFLCNERSEVEVFSTGPNLFVEFVANSDWPGHGFKARYQFLPIDDNFLDTNRFDRARPKLGPSVGVARTGCDLSFTSDLSRNGSISSPHYPDPYPGGTVCRYEFEGRGKERIRVQFVDFQMYTNQNYLSDNCNNQDSVFAYVHVEGRTDKIATFCGSYLPNPVMSNGPRLLLEFHSLFGDQVATSRGFKAIYSFTENYGVTRGVQIPDYPCAFVFTCNESRSGRFHSPNYPGAYPRDTECHYFFYGNDDEVVQLRFDGFDVEGVQPCDSTTASDYVEFSNYMRIDSDYRRHCGQMKPFVINSKRKFFRMTFRSNDRLDGHGFNASYVFMDKVELETVPPNKVSEGSQNYELSSRSVMVLTMILYTLI